MTYYVTCDITRPARGNELKAVPAGAEIWCGRIKATVDGNDLSTAYNDGKAIIEHACRGTFSPLNFGAISKHFADAENPGVYDKVHECGRLFVLRNWREMTQTQLADAAGIPYRTIQKYETGEADPENMTIATARKLAKALRVTIDDLL